MSLYLEADNTQVARCSIDFPVVITLAESFEMLSHLPFFAAL